MIFDEVDTLLDSYDLVFLVPDEDAYELAKSVVSLGVLFETQKRIAFLSVFPLEADLPEHLVKQIGKAEMDKLSDIYRTYEVSDRLVSLSSPKQYGGLRNYVKTGIISPEEMLRAIVM